MDPLNFEDVFPYKNGDITGYPLLCVSLPEGIIDPSTLCSNFGISKPFSPLTFFQKTLFPSNILPTKRLEKNQTTKKDQTSSTDLRMVRPQDGASFQLRLLGLLHQVVPEKCKVPSALRNVGLGCDVPSGWR